MASFDNNTLYDYDLSYDEWLQEIRQFIFDETDRYILQRHLLDNATFEQIADEIKGGVSVKTVKRRYRTSSDRLFSRMICNKRIAPR